VQLFVELLSFFVPLLLVVSLDKPLNPAVGSLSRIVEVSEGELLVGCIVFPKLVKCIHLLLRSRRVSKKRCKYVFCAYFLLLFLFMVQRLEQFVVDTVEFLFSHCEVLLQLGLGDVAGVTLVGLTSIPAFQDLVAMGIVPSTLLVV
jgi:hypothetical protein